MISSKNSIRQGLPLKTNDPKVQVYVKIPISMFNAIHDYVDFAGITMAGFIRDAIREGLARVHLEEKNRGKTNRME
jgi:hypothetical protein